MELIRIMDRHSVHTWEHTSVKSSSEVSCEGEVILPLDKKAHDPQKRKPHNTKSWCTKRRPPIIQGQGILKGRAKPFSFKESVVSQFKAPFTDTNLPIPLHSARRVPIVDAVQRSIRVTFDFALCKEHFLDCWKDNKTLRTGAQ